MHSPVRSSAYSSALARNRNYSHLASGRVLVLYAVMCLTQRFALLLLAKFLTTFVVDT